MFSNKICVSFIRMTKQITTMWWLKTTEIYSFKVLEPKVWNQGAGSLPFHLKPLQENLSCLFQLLVSPKVVWLWQHSSSLCLHLHKLPLGASIVSLFGILFFFWPFIKTLVIGFRIHPNPRWSHLEILTLIISAKAFIPNKITYWGSGQTCLWGNTI